MTEAAYDGWCVTRYECMKELGYALFYIEYENGGDPWPDDQRTRVKNLCLEWKENREKPGREYWEGLLRRIRDETENMC